MSANRQRIRIENHFRYLLVFKCRDQRCGFFIHTKSRTDENGIELKFYSINNVAHDEIGIAKRRNRRIKLSDRDISTSRSQCGFRGKHGRPLIAFTACEKKTATTLRFIVALTNFRQKICGTFVSENTWGRNEMFHVHQSSKT
ncbi:hypothetical protein D3C87_1734190 [compost metagenome]